MTGQVAKNAAPPRVIDLLPEVDVSVVMPTWNRPQFIAAAIDSVFKQTVAVRELIIADDGSDTPTRELLLDYAALPRVRVLWRDHTGNPGAVRNAAIHEACGRYVAFADSDDRWHPEKLGRQLAALAAQPRCRWSYTSGTFIDAHGSTVASPASPGRTRRAASLLESIATLEGGVTLPTVLAERSLILEAGMFDESFGVYEDCDLWLRMAALSDAAALDDALIEVRRHEQHFSRRDARATLLGREAFLARAIGRVPAADLRARLRHMRALDNARIAGLAASAGDAREASTRLRESFASGWRLPHWWLLAARTQSRLWARRAFRPRAGS